MSAGAPTVLHGWGRTSPSVATVRTPVTADEVAAAVRGAGDRGVLARGLGRSYGDPAQNAGGTVLDMTHRRGVRRLDVDAAVVEVEAGTSLDELLRVLLGVGLTLPVQPGTRQVSVGGAIAADVHGKNHHVAGSFGAHVRWVDLLTADGAVQRLRPDGPDPELFWGTVGGMGLTGVVLRAELSVRRVETSSVVVTSERHGDLGEVMDALTRLDHEAEYSVAWFDSVSRGRGSGRGVVLSGHDARLDELPVAQRRTPYAVPPPRSVAVPLVPPVSLVNRLSGRAFNELWFRRAPRHPGTGVEHAFGFFQPLDGVASWNRLYGPRGLAQYQLAVPHDAAAVVPEVVAAVAASGHVSCLNVLKRFGPGTPSPLSFPMPGWTLALDLPVAPGLAGLLDRLDAMVLEAGGRVYLAKDSRTPAHHLAAMYPDLPRFAALRRRVDPEGRFASDLARRLGLLTPTPAREARP
ncbi:decaprenylphosphoryl-beta-D-ribose oxidase [Marmoricola sp. Leaf446]|uniref:FAD-binding oxidoreductase n=1 Tax=Marmoricola sp. Leaf446 TaxID=1736379 RepID=UPI0006F841E9|nr:FAD-binding oxidoreductase [Marmoricola sp. Leaf446]KQT89525.1 decaprenylphosphoryl-beta-D-ribose oxidase [Marmoricola sp. Leaf446]